MGHVWDEGMEHVWDDGMEHVWDEGTEHVWGDGMEHVWINGVGHVRDRKTTGVVGLGSRGGYVGWLPARVRPASPRARDGIAGRNASASPLI
jgi:hypothetical protein